MTFSTDIKNGYTFSTSSVALGVANDGKKVYPDLSVSIPLSTMNRHGLIAGATGTGKTKTIQKLLESLSEAGVPTIMMDMKGDVSGIAMPGVLNEKITARLGMIGKTDWMPTGYPTEFYAIGEGKGVILRSTVAEFGPLLLSRILELNDTQSSVISLVFHYCDTEGLLLVDLEDLKKVLQYIANEGKKDIEADYGMVASATVGTIMRKIIALESEGAGAFFGMPSFAVTDFLRTDKSGKGAINVIRLMEMIRKPRLFSTFMLSLLSEIFSTFPEVGDLEKPKLVLVIDEAHLIFEDISPALLSEIELIVKLIRSKGVGVYFCTQNPIDIPESILAQLGLKIQHALRAFTAKDREAIEKASKNFPLTEAYTVEDEITTLATGEAFVTALSPSGAPTPLVRAIIEPPQSCMDVLTDAELDGLTSTSELASKYREGYDPLSAREILEKKIAEKLKANEDMKKPERSVFDGVGGTLARSVTRSLGTEIGRSIGKSIGGRTGGTLGADIARTLLGSIFGRK